MRSVIVTLIIIEHQKERAHWIHYCFCEHQNEHIQESLGTMPTLDLKADLKKTSL